MRVTVPENVHCPVLPAASVALYVKMILPVGKGMAARSVLIGMDCPDRSSRVLTMPTLSVGGVKAGKGRSRNVVGSPSGITPLRLSGHVTMGASLSSTVITNVQEPELPAKSYAMHVTGVLPSGNTVRVNDTEHATKSTPTLSNTVRSTFDGGCHATVPFGRPADVKPTYAVGHVTVGD
jgi:hypothetical protein